MPLESAFTIDELNPNNPTGLDEKQEGDDHLRMIKRVLKGAFPALNGAFAGRRSIGENYTIAPTDNYSFFLYTTSAALNLPAPASFPSGFLAFVAAVPGVTVSLAPGTGATLNRGTAPFPINSLDIALLFCDGLEWFVAQVQHPGDTSLQSPLLSAPMEVSVALGSVLGQVSLPVLTTSVYRMTLDGNISLSLQTAVSLSNRAVAVTLFMTQGSAGSHLASWPQGTVWSGGVPPVLTTTAGRTDVITLLYPGGGTSWYGFVAGLNFP